MLLKDFSNSNTALMKRNNVIICRNKILGLRNNCCAYKPCKTNYLHSNFRFWLPHWDHSHAYHLSTSVTFTRHAGPFSPGNGKFKSSGGEQLGEMRWWPAEASVSNLFGSTHPWISPPLPEKYRIHRLFKQKCKTEQLSSMSNTELK